MPVNRFSASAARRAVDAYTSGEATSVKAAAALVGASETALRRWCAAWQVPIKSKADAARDREDRRGSWDKGAAIAAMITSGASSRDISSSLHCCKQRVAAARRILGIKPPCRVSPKERAMAQAVGR